MDAKIWMISLIIMFAVRPICVQDSIFKMSGASPVWSDNNICRIQIRLWNLKRCPIPHPWGWAVLSEYFGEKWQCHKDILLHNHSYFPPDGRSLHEEFEDAMQEGPMEPRPRPPAAAPASPDPSASEETATETEESGDTESDSGEILRFFFFFK